MTAEIAQLIEVLERSESIYQQLLPVFLKEKNAALQSDPEAFSAVVQEKEELLVRLQQIEQKRQLILNGISKTHNIAVDQLRLSILANRAIDDHQARRIMQLRASLNDLVQKTKRANEENRLLIQHCLEIVKNALGFFRSWVVPTDVYGSSGLINTHKKNGNLVSGAV